MKKFICAILAAALAMPLAACENTDSAEGKLQVYTSFYAVRKLAEEIGGDKAAIYSLCPSDTDPHSYVPQDDELSAILNADMFIYNGMGMENWIAEVSETTLGTDVVLVEASQDAPNISEDYDPHIWLDPDNAYSELYTITTAFMNADPENSEYYMNRLEACREKIDKLKAKYKKALAPYSGSTIVTAHRAYFSMCNAFSLSQIAIYEVDNTPDPLPVHINEVKSFIEANEIKYIFDEPLSDGAAEEIAEATGCEVLTLDPFEGGKKEKDYFTVMESNLKALLAALD